MRLQPSSRQIASVLRHYGITHYTATAAAFGEENATYLIDAARKRLVLRIYQPGRKSTGEIQTEIDFAELIRTRLGVTPRILENQRGERLTLTPMGQGNWRSIVMEFVPGEHPQTYSSEIIRNLAEVQAKMHLLGIDYVDKLRDPTRTRNHRTINQDLPAHYGNKRRPGRMIASRLPVGYAHFDLFGSNIITNNNRIVAIIDFDDAHVGPVVGCLATTMGLIARAERSIKKLRHYLQAYRALRPLSRREFMTLKVILVMKFGVISAFWL